MEMCHMFDYANGALKIFELQPGLKLETEKSKKGQYIFFTPFLTFFSHILVRL